MRCRNRYEERHGVMEDEKFTPYGNYFLSVIFTKTWCRAALKAAMTGFSSFVLLYAPGVSPFQQMMQMVLGGILKPLVIISKIEW